MLLSQLVYSIYFTNSGDASSLVLNPDYLVPINDPCSLFEAIYRFSQLSYTQRRLDGFLSRRKIVSSFSLELMVSKYIDCYSSLLVEP